MGSFEMESEYTLSVNWTGSWIGNIFHSWAGIWVHVCGWTLYNVWAQAVYTS